MKILQVVPFFTPVRGGSVAVPYNLSKELSKRGHDVTIITTDFELNEEYAKSLDDVKVIPFKCTAKLGLFLYSPEMKKWLRDNIKNFDIAHMHNFRSYQNNVTHNYAKRFNTPYILQAHGSVLPAFGIQYLKKLYDLEWGYKILKDAIKVIALTETEAEQYKKMGVDENKIEIIPNGLDLSQYQKLPPKGSFKKKYGIEDNRKIVLYLARIHQNKGPDILVKAFAQLKKNVDLNNVVLVLAGPDDGFLSTVKSLIAQVGLNKNILITGPVSEEDKIAAYVDADIYVLPSRYEPFGITILEAYACGIPVVAPRIEGPKELVVDGVTGILFDPCNVKHLGHTIAVLLNDKRAREMGLRAKRYVEENYSIEKVVDKLEKLYETVVSGRAY